MGKSREVVLVVFLSFIYLTFFAGISEGKSLSYGAIGGDIIPCDHKRGFQGNCHPTIPINHYNRGCSPLTRCRGNPPHVH